MISLFFRNLLFTILQPGIVAGYVPYLIVGNETNTLFSLPLKLYHYPAILIGAVGTTIMLICIASFAIKGRGTLSPVDPTKNLVITGLYRFSRNPMYVGVMLMLIGESIFFQSDTLWVYTLIVFLAFHLFILLIEEPRLRKDFKEAYDDYCKEVRRWI